MNLFRLSSVAVVGLAIALLVNLGCSNSPKTESQPEQQAAMANTICPIMGGDVDTTGKTAQWGGKTIGFCCDDCLPKWNKLSDEEKEEKLAKADKAG